MNGWIPIKEALPNQLDMVIVTLEHQHRWVSFAWMGNDKAWHYADNGERIPMKYKIIAWQPLPEPYLEVK